MQFRRETPFGKEDTKGYNGFGLNRIMNLGRGFIKHEI
jgi:hypothetical protein